MEYKLPEKLINNPMKMGVFLRSSAYHKVIRFIQKCSGQLVNTTMNTALEETPAVKMLLDLFDELDCLIDETPPLPVEPGALRFGNKAYVAWAEKKDALVVEQLPLILAESNLSEAAIEAGLYFCESFGNSTRIDYGTGHETNFLCFLLVLDEIGYFGGQAQKEIILAVFQRYLLLCRRLQIDYRMEPAGSHGAYSLDDFQFLCFLFGSVQMGCQNDLSGPTCFAEPSVVSRFGAKYMFLQAIEHINNVKTGPFAEHSNTLWGVSGAKNWDKVQNGMMKMYKAEVLGKFPVMQHFYFGSVLTLEPVPRA